jgi:hypothetical protein
MENREDDGYDNTSGHSLPDLGEKAATSQQAPGQSAHVVSMPRESGRELGWSDDELTALVVQSYDVDRDPTVGAGQTAES